jgi:hypothetical protein
MANTNMPRGFKLLNSAGREARRVERTVLVGNDAAIAPGDAYFINAGGDVTRAEADEVVSGICEAVVLQGVDQGPMSYSYLPATTAGKIIGIEDSDAEFEVQCVAQIDLADLDLGAYCDLVDAVPDATLGQSRQYVADVGGTAVSKFKLVRVIDRVDNVAGAYNKVVVKMLVASVV